MYMYKCIKGNAQVRFTNEHIMTAIQDKSFLLVGFYNPHANAILRTWNCYVDLTGDVPLPRVTFWAQIP